MEVFGGLRTSWVRVWFSAMLLKPVFINVSNLVWLLLLGVSKAVEHINKTIAPALVSKVGPASW